MRICFSKTKQAVRRRKMNTPKVIEIAISHLNSSSNLLWILAMPAHPQSKHLTISCQQQNRWRLSKSKLRAILLPASPPFTLRCPPPINWKYPSWRCQLQINKNLAAMLQRIKIRIRMRSQSRLTPKNRKIVMIGKKVAHLTTLSSKVVIRIALTLQNLIMAELLASRTLWELVRF